VVTVREAATVMLLRDDPDLHVFMLRRNLHADFVGGAFVFPGGAVDPGDRSPELLRRSQGRTEAEADGLLGVAEGGLGVWVAAIREAFEEAGVVLARSASTGEPVELTDPPIADRLAVARGAVAHGAQPFLDVVRDHDLVLDTGALHLFSRWITPPGNSRRYDTWFFVAAAPEGHAYVHDDGETVASEWVRPADALERGRTGDIELIFPTMRSLTVLARFDTAVALLDTLARLGPTPVTAMIRDFNGARVPLPGDERDKGEVAECLT
jgi:8-oxo-dGTP pyrophosphatase MutT (NUDIX family)